MIPTLPELLQRAHEARGDDLSAVEILVEARTGLELRLEGRRPLERAHPQHTLMEVRVWTEDGRPGHAEGVPEQLAVLLAHARKAALRADPEPLGAPLRRADTPPRGIGVDDPRQEQLTEADRVEVLTTAMRAAARGEGRASSGPFRYTEVRETRRFASSAGVSLEGRSTTYGVSGEVVLSTEEGPLRLTEQASARAFATVACLPFGNTLADRVRALSRPRVSPTGPLRVLLPPRVTGALFAWLGDRIAEDRPFVQRARTEEILSRKLHLIDDGVLPGGLRTVAFDDRGSVPRPVTLIAEGHVVGRYVDLAQARRTESIASGHLRRGSLRPSNLQVNGGTRSINAWMGEQSVPVLAIDALDDLSGLDPIHGRIDVTVNGVLHQAHTILGAVRGLRLQGSVLEALSQVVAVTSDTDRVLHVDAPGLFLDGLVAG